MGAATVDILAAAASRDFGNISSRLREEQVPERRQETDMNGHASPAFEDKKPSLPAAGGSISATKASPTLPESSSTDMGFYSGGSQDFYPAQQQPYAAQHMNPYAYHHYSLGGMAGGGAYPVGKAEYPYPHAAYREHGAFSRDVQSAMHDAGERTHNALRSPWERRVVEYGSCLHVESVRLLREARLGQRVSVLVRDRDTVLRRQEET